MSRRSWKKSGIPCVFNATEHSLHGEEWRPVIGWELHYRVSNLGRVYSLHERGRLVTGMRVRDGYRVMKLRSNGRRANRLVHHLVLEAFVGPSPLGCEACHGAAGAFDNSVFNLRWDTRLANCADKIVHGTSLNGRVLQRKLTEEIVRNIRLGSDTDKFWAEKLGLTSTSVYHARIGKTWKDVSTPLQKRRLP
jgi:hypothetical protein